MDRQTIIANAQATCKAAREATPEHLRSFIMDLPQSKKLGSEYISIEVPYMTVDGRVSWAHIEAQEKGEKVVIKTELCNLGDIPMIMATVTTPRGTATGHSPIRVGGKNVDATNPVENAETSAVGRALGFLGYGNYGMGIASADEVQSAQSRNGEPTRIPNMVNVPRKSGATEKQRDFIHSLAEDMGWSAGEAEAFIDTLETPQEASEAITKMKDREDPRPPFSRPEAASSASNGERQPMNDSTRKAFFTELSKVGKWKGYRDQAAQYIRDMGWGTPEEPGTTKYLNHSQRQAVIGFVAEMEGPGWEVLLGPDSGRWKNVIAWGQSVKLAPWDTAMWLMREFGPKCPEAKGPYSFTPEVIEEIEKAIAKSGDILIDDIKDYAAELKAF